MEPVFRIAIGVSIALHSAIIAPLVAHHRAHERVKTTKELTVDYVAHKEEPAKQAPVREKVTETPRVEMKKPEMEPTPAEKKSPPAKKEAAKKEAEAQARAEAKIRSTKDYINYYQLMRGRIRDRLKEHYRTYFGEGSVSLVFVVTESGDLQSSAVDTNASARDETLHDIALKSLHEAAPFPPFPKALTLPRMTFTLQVGFKRE